MRRSRLLTRAALITALVVPGFFSISGLGVAAGTFSSGQTVYVGAYSSIPVGEKGRHFDLAATLCIRNTDIQHPVTIVSAEYHDTAGKLVRSYLNGPIQLGPLAATHFFLKPSDTSGGLTPSFLVRWRSEVKVSEPLIEAVMIGDRSGLGISLVSRGKVIKDSPD